jgi:hypothetical protein
MYLDEVKVPMPLPRRCAVSIVRANIILGSIQQMGPPVFNLNSPYLNLSSAGAGFFHGPTKRPYHSETPAWR